METFKADRANDPAQWTEQWDKGPREHSGHINPFYPTDGRDTIYEPYEAYASTGTIGGYLAARERALDGDPALPKDFGAYLSQRTAWPSDQLFLMPHETALDRRGNPQP